MDIKRIQTEKAPPAVGPYSQAVESGDFIFISGSLGIDPGKGELRDTLEEQVEQSLTNIKNILESQGRKLKSIVKTTIFLADMNDFKVMNRIYADFFKDTKPARSTIEVSGLPLNAKVEIEAIAV
ncbi:MAG: RidA family protein, partial [Spirochaetes bacterium]|nr:RidA family protein [Spirochaetota bacterium]